MSSMAEDTDIQIDRKDIEIDKGDVLGRGGFGHVFAANLSDGTRVAVKLLIDEGFIPDRNRQELKREGRRLKELGHHCSVIDLHGVLLEKDSYGLVLEYMHFGSSYEFVRNYKQVELPLLLRMTCQVASAMMYLHSYNPPILHLDLKADNVLIDRFFNAKVSDFGLSEWRTVSKMFTTGGSEANRRCTITHIAPEVLRDVNHRSTEKLDVYAFGITVWEFFAAERPYGAASDDVIRQAVCHGQRPGLPNLPGICPSIIRLMLSKCWNHSPTMRPPFSTVLVEMEKAFDDHKNGIPQALKSLRQKICEKYNVNDPEYIDTEYLDENTETDSVPMETEMPEETKPGVAEPERVAEPEKMEENDDGGQSGLKRSPPLEYRPRSTELTQEELQLRRVLRDPVAFELVQTPAGDNIPLSGKMRDIVRDPVKLREYINNNPELRYEMLRSGSPVLSKLRALNIRNNGAEGRCEQKMAEKKQKLFTSDRLKKTNIDMNELNDDEKRQVERCKNLQNASYGQKLYNNELGLKLLKVLKEPHKLESALKNRQANESGGQQKFETIDRRVMDAAQDPVLLQILLSQDYRLLDALMSEYPTLMMSLISANKTGYRSPAESAASAKRSSVRNPNESGGSVQATSTVNRTQPTGISHEPTRVLRNVDMENGLSKESNKSIPKEIEKNESGRKAENERRMKEILEEAKRKSEEEKRKRDKEAKKKYEQDVKRREDERKNEERRKRLEEERRKRLEKKEKHKERGDQSGYLGKLFGIFRGPQNASLFDSNSQRIAMPENPVSLQSMDKLSMEVDELSNYGGLPAAGSSERTHANPLAPRPEANPASPLKGQGNPLPARPEASLAPPEVQPEPNTTNRRETSPRNSPTNSSSGTSQGSANSKTNSGESRKTPPGGGATGGATGHNRNITISHQHAGGGFSHITINPDSPHQPNIQVGNRNLMVIGGDSDTDDDERAARRRTPRRRQREIKLPDQPLDMDRLDIVCTGIGKHWKRLCREMGLDEPAIEQIEQDYHINGTYEIMYQALQRWIQKNGKAATIKALGQHLANIDRYDLMKKLK